MNLNKILEALKEKGYKSTEQRKAIIQSIINQKRYVSAKDILNQVQVEYPSVSFDTIYRNLSLLTDLNMLEETQQNGESKYKISCVDDHHHHLICTNCGEISILSQCPMDLLQLITGDFKITEHKFEIYGLCIKCQTV